MTKIYGSAEYTVQQRENEEIHTIIWTVPEVVKLLNDGKLKGCDITPNISETAPNKTFQLKINVRSLGLLIYYLSPTSLFLKLVELKNFTFDLSNWTYNELEQIIFKHEHRLTSAGYWEYLGSLWKNQYSTQEKGLYLENNKKILCLLDEGNLRLKLEFVVTTTNNNKVSCKIPESQLIRDFGKLFRDGSYSDVVIKSAEGKEFRVYKGVLASRSAVLKAHFDHNTTESISNIVESPLVSDVLREVLSFIYTDEAPKLNEMPEKLLAAADYYQLSRLKSLCEETLLKKLTVDNAIEMLQLADLHSADTLKELTLKFIKRDDEQRKLIYKTQGWAELKSVDFIKMISE